jgi:hypothetical protein
MQHSCLALQALTHAHALIHARPHAPPCRQIKAHDRKIRKAQAKLNPELAKRLAALTPSYRLDHLVKER